MIFDHALDGIDVVNVDQRIEIDHLGVAQVREQPVLVQDVRFTAAHSSGEVAAGRAEHDDSPVGHVFATVVADALHHGFGAAVADAEPLARDAADEHFTGCRAVQRRVAYHDVVFVYETRTRRRLDDHFAAGQPFAEVVVGVAIDVHGDACRKERREALARGAREIDRHRVFGQGFFAVSSCDVVAQGSADRSIRVVDRQVERDRPFVLERVHAEFDEFVVERLVESVVLTLTAERRDVIRHLRLRQKIRKVESLGLPVVDCLTSVESIHATDHLVDGAEPDFGHDLTELFGHEEEVVDYVLRLSCELGP